MAKVVVGLYDRLENAQRAVEELTSNGFARENISLVAADTEGKYGQYVESEGQGEDISDGAAAGAGIGAVTGGLGGLLVGLGVLAIPGIGPVLAAGPLISTLVGAGIGAAAGGLIGALVDLGIPEDQAELYSEGVRRGGTLVTVNTPDERADQAADIMNRHDPIDINERATQWRSDQWEGFDRTATPYTADQFTAERERSYLGDLDRGELEREDLTAGMDREDVSAEVVEEEMAVGKRKVDQGGVRIRSYITERPVEESVDLRKEHIDVERRPVDRPATEADLDTFEEGTIEVTATSEEPVVEKRARVVEEVEVHKDVDTERETIQDTLRRKDVDVESMGTGRTEVGMDEYEPMFRSHYQTNYSQMGRNYDELRPAYHYGYTLANDPRYRDRDWDQIRDEARRDWETRHQDSLWDDVQDAVREGWMRVKGAF